MIDVGSTIAVAFAAFACGAAYSRQGSLTELRAAVRARAIVVDGRAHVLSPLFPDPPAPEPERAPFKPTVVQGEAA